MEQRNDQILEIIPAHPTQRHILASEIKYFIQRSAIQSINVLELGCGSWWLSTYVLDKIQPITHDLSYTLVDKSWYMIEQAKQVLKKHISSLKFVTQDAFAYMRDSTDMFDCISFARFLHNFPLEAQREMFTLAYKKLYAWGILLFQEKIFPDNEDFARSLLALQLDRYNRYLLYNDTFPDEVAFDMISHEQEDFGEIYKMKEWELIEVLRSIWFRDVRVVDRVECHQVIMAKRK